MAECGLILPEYDKSQDRKVGRRLRVKHRTVREPTYPHKQRLIIVDKSCQRLLERDTHKKVSEAHPAEELCDTSRQCRGADKPPRPVLLQLISSSSALRHFLCTTGYGMKTCVLYGSSTRTSNEFHPAWAANSACETTAWYPVDVAYGISDKAFGT